MTTKMVILGASGYTGRCLARHLLEQSEVRVRIATRHIGMAQAFADELNQHFPGRRTEAVYADAADVVSLKDAFYGQDLALVAAPTTAYTEVVAREALKMGMDYLDVVEVQPKGSSSYWQVPLVGHERFSQAAVPSRAPGAGHRAQRRAADKSSGERCSSRWLRVDRHPGGCRFATIHGGNCEKAWAVGGGAPG